ncbi:MAG: RDD family protein [Candidatus Latescibacteria bacterium]|jgi:uncharacterized RDD family membrane protein YckC|nr:RDD family protein [Candidatus Latescibacterota bacterium]MBT4140152.1 RDD family protein [Candidatus Latescibacterota bacterium]MBT5829359.1 RDD family protein [Candidatus Latescibacterota bacterium]
MLLQSEIAGVGRRAMATVLDLVILFIGLSFVARGMVLSPVGMWLVDFVIAICYSGLLIGMRGQTLGMMALGVRVIPAGEGGLDYGQTFKRAAFKWLPIFGVFILLAVFIPDELRNRGMQQSMIEQVEINSDATMIPTSILLLGSVLWLFLLHNARRHPDGQAYHDRLSDTCVTKTM